MTNGREKSDSAIVAVKPTNKAERSAAEPVEPRARTKGNAEQGDTLRAPSREGASHGLNHVRRAANHNVRFAVKHPRWEPYARIGPVRICAGGAQQ